MQILAKVTIMLFFLTAPSYAYLGPGVGGGMIAATIGIIIAILAAIFGLIWFPIKRLLKKIRHKKEIKQNKID